MNIQSSNSYLVNTNGFGADVIRIFDKRYASTREQLNAYINNAQRELNQLQSNDSELYHEIHDLNTALVKISESCTDTLHALKERLDKMEQKIERKQRKVYWNNEKT